MHKLNDKSSQTQVSERGICLLLRIHLKLLRMSLFGHANVQGMTTRSLLLPPPISQIFLRPSGPLDSSRIMCHSSSKSVLTKVPLKAPEFTLSPVWDGHGRFGKAAR